MILNRITKVFDANERELNRLRSVVDKVNSLEKEYKNLSFEKLAEKTAEFKLRHERGETLDDLLPEAFAVVRSAIEQEVGERAYDVQLMAAIALHEGKIAEFEANPNLKEIIQVRYLDEAGKRADMETPDFAHFAPMVQRMVDRHLGAA